MRVLNQVILAVVMTSTLAVAQQLCGQTAYTWELAAGGAAWIEWQTEGTTFSLTCSIIGSNGTSSKRFASSTAITAYVACRSSDAQEFILDNSLPTVLQGSRSYTCPVTGKFYVVFHTTVVGPTPVTYQGTASIDNDIDSYAVAGHE